MGFKDLHLSPSSYGHSLEKGFFWRNKKEAKHWHHHLRVEAIKHLEFKGRNEDKTKLKMAYVITLLIEAFFFVP